MGAVRVVEILFKNGERVRFHAEGLTVTRDPTTGAVTNMQVQALPGTLRMRAVVFPEILAVTEEPVRPTSAMEAAMRSDPDLEP